MGFWDILFFFVERRTTWLKRIVATLGVSLALFFPASFEPEVSYLAHAIGYGLGVLIGAIYFYFRRKGIRKHETWSLDWDELISDSTNHSEVLFEPLA